MKLKALIPVFCILTSISGCDSPVNNKVRYPDTRGKAQPSTFQFATQSIEVNLQWLRGPYGSVKQNNHLLVVLKKEGIAHSLPSTQTLGFNSIMESMGHPLEDPGRFTEISPGVYLNNTIRYNMPGDWNNELVILDSQLNILDSFQWLEYF